ncbi:hypothetical protein [Brevundimonas sp.]|uniref:hypothetical protein n=1 Tax=Brevundimonas sp. TaxID=1871086 RepID=UPI002D743AD6|nr:hypothetical protein [Brevundimonas sp.]HYC75147.1 hypothetical protein [Brevundimonas sp.]
MAKYANAFLEVRWCWPRTSSALSHYCYLLADPRADRLDTAELARLSDELEVRLFGTAASEALTLLLFEGPAEAIEEFAALSDADVRDLLSSDRNLPKEGRLSRIGPDGALSPVPPSLSQPMLLPLDLPPPVDEAVQGIYFAGRELFVGDVLSCTPGDAERHASLVEGEPHLPSDAVEFDNGCVLAALRHIGQRGLRAPLYLPVSFSKLMRPTMRSGYAELLHCLPFSARPSLAAAVYDVPRVMSYQALRVVHDTLDEHFSAIDLQTFDPGFEVLQLSTRAVRSVTLSLPTARSDVRLAALRRFGARANEFKRRQIWTGVTNIRTRAECDTALGLRVPFITGPAICQRQDRLLGGALWAYKDLPVTSPEHRDASA